MGAFQNKTNNFGVNGINLRYPVDQMPAGYCPQAVNVRVLTEGTLQPRNGTQSVGDTISFRPITALRRLNNYITGLFTRILVSNGILFSGVSAFTNRDTGYTGNSSMVPFRPNQSPEPWMYVADTSKMRKIRQDGTNYLMGIVPPVHPPSTELGNPTFEIVEYFEPVSGTAWTNTGTAGSISGVSRVNTTIQFILYDSGTTGWCTVVPTLADNNLQPGMFLNFNGVSNYRVKSVTQPIVTTTVAGIAFDVFGATTGLCCIQVTSASSGMVPNCLVAIGAETVRVLSVTLSQSGLPSFRCNVLAPHSIGEAVTGFVSFRTFTFTAFSSGVTLEKSAFTSTFSAGLGTIQETAALNLNVLTDGWNNPGTVTTRPLTSDDYLHISLLVDNPSNIVTGRILVDIDATVNDFQHNAYYFEFQASAFQNNVTGVISAVNAGQTAIQQGIVNSSLQSTIDQLTKEQGDPTLNQDLIQQEIAQLQQLGDNSGVSTAGTGTTVITGSQVTGTSQWTEFLIPIATLLQGRIGSDQSRSLANVAALGIQLQVLDTTVLVADSWWVGGGYGPDTGETGTPLLHAYRYKSSVTGAISNNSPATRTGLDPKRDYCTVKVNASTDPQVDQIEVFHFGAGENVWTLTAVGPNVSGLIQDQFSTLATALNTQLAFDDYLPFPTSDLPRTGVCNATGTTITWVSGDLFNVNWVPGSEVVVNGITCHIYASPLSTKVLQLVESVGQAPGAVFSLPEPTIQGNPLPVMWGPFGGTQFGNVMFAVGDKIQPGNLYWTKPSSPDTASDTGFVEVTSPSEPLMNGFTYDGKAFVFSSQRLFAIFAQTDTSGNISFTTQEVPNGKGLISAWAFCVGPVFWWVNRSGIYSSTGAAPTSITDDALYPLFPHEGAQPVVPIYGVYPPDFSTAQGLASMKLAYADNSVYFIYLDVGGVYRCLRYDIDRQGWFFHIYNVPPSIIYQEEGEGVDSVLLGTFTGLVNQVVESPSDALGNAITCLVQTPSDPIGLPRTNKLYGDVFLDIDPQGVGVSVVAATQEGTVMQPAQVFASGSRVHPIYDLENGDGVIGRNLGLVVSWSSATETPVLYEWTPSYVVKVEDTEQRATDWDNGGFNGLKFVQGMRLTADTQNLPTVLQVQSDTGTVEVAGVTCVHNGQVTIAYSWPPFMGHELRIVPSGENPIRIYAVEWIFEPMPDLAVLWQTQGTTHDLPGFHHHRDGYIAVYSPVPQTLTLGLQTSQGTAGYTFAVGVGQTRVYLVLGANKSNLTAYKVSGPTAFALFQRDCELRVKAWGDTGPYVSKNPFGDISRAKGATI